MVAKNDLMAFVHYGVVTRTHYNGLYVKDVDHGHEFMVQGKTLIDKAYSADEYNQTQNCSKTEAAELLVQAGIRPFTVVFVKSNGKERTLRGRLVRPEPLLGRSMVEDLDLQNQERVRQVDHRTIKSLVINKVKYVVK
jgi:hypothetical protein